jgi:ABC-type Zn uptake system ZnuABC Zn-binding protein ZnuA
MGRSSNIWTRFFSSAIVLSLLVGGFFSGCRDTEQETNAERGETEKPIVVATTTMLTDLAEQIGGDDVSVEGIVQPGADPHIYQPRPSDARLISRSDLVIMNGLHLEGWMERLIKNAGGQRPVLKASERVEPINASDSPGGVDPHFWFELDGWKVAAENVARSMKELFPEGVDARKRIQNRLEAYREKTARVDRWVQKQFETIADGKRVLVTSHDAFSYLGRAYDIEVVGIQGISTEGEASQRDVANVIELVERKNAPAVFVETSVNPSLIEQVAAETGAKVAGPLYSDSIGTEDSPADTFLNTVIENTRMIVEGLGGKFRKPEELK